MNSNLESFIVRLHLFIRIRCGCIVVLFFVMTVHFEHQVLLYDIFGKAIKLFFRNTCQKSYFRIENNIIKRRKAMNKYFMYTEYKKCSDNKIHIYPVMNDFVIDDLDS